MISKDELRAGLLAPLAAGPILLIYMGIGSPSIFSSFYELVKLLLIYSALAGGVAYIGALTVGLPVVLILKKLGLYGPLTVSIFGFISPVLVIWLLDSAVKIDSFIMMFAVCGLGVSVVYAILLWRPHITK